MWGDARIWHKMSTPDLFPPKSAYAEMNRLFLAWGTAPRLVMGQRLEEDLRVNVAEHLAADQRWRASSDLSSRCYYSKLLVIELHACAQAMDHNSRQIARRQTNELGSLSLQTGNVCSASHGTTAGGRPQSQCGGTPRRRSTVEGERSLLLLVGHELHACAQAMDHNSLPGASELSKLADRQRMFR